MLPGAEQVGVLAGLTRDKWIGIGLAVSSSLAIGISSIITKKVSRCRILSFSLGGLLV